MITDFPLDRALPPGWLTVPASRLYGLGAAVYHRWHDRAKPARVQVPVISVGNIVVGGTGKTPFVIALARWLINSYPALAAQDRIAILSRGYGRMSKEIVVVRSDSAWEDAGDEPILIKRAVPEAAVVVYADRRQSADFVTRNLGSRLILLDDAFQHRRLARDLDIVLVDGEHPLGNGCTLPAGPLREPAHNLKRATVIVGVGATSEAASSLATQLEKPFMSAVATPRLPEALKDGSIRRVGLMASVARPTRFVNGIKNNNLNVVSQSLFADHYRYRTADLERVAARASEAGAEAIVTTEKDAARIPVWNYPVPMYVCGLEMQFGDDTLLRKLMPPIVGHS